jgi:hypothetical protein
MTRSSSLKISHDQQCYGLVGLTGNAAASDADDNQKLADLGVSLASVLVRDSCQWRRIKNLWSGEL